MNIRQGYVFSLEDAINLQPRSRLEIILASFSYHPYKKTLKKEHFKRTNPEIMGNNIPENLM